MKTITITALHFLFAATLANAQSADSTLSFATENVGEFKKQTILEEYEVPYERQTDQKRMFRIGVNEGSIPIGMYIERAKSFPFEISYLNKIGNRSAILIGLTGTHGQIAGTTLNLRMGYRNYLKSDSDLESSRKFSFTGRYVGIETAIDLNEFPYSISNAGSGLGVYYSYLNLPYYDSKAQVSAIYGLQLGGAFDFAIKAGVKYIGNGRVNNDFILNYNNPTILPFISTNSLLSLSIGGGRKTVRNDCEFLNCNRQTDQLFKLDLSNLIYLDPFIGNLNIGGAYERRIGRSNFTSNTFSKIGLSYSKRFDNKFNYQPSTPPETPNGGAISFPTFYYYEQTSYYDFSFNGSLGTEIRFYPLKNREVLNGKSAQNLNGPYIKAFAELSYISTSKYKKLLAERGSLLVKPQTTVIEYGIGLGYQKKVGSKYFYDVFIDYRKTNSTYKPLNNGNGFQFGTRFGFTK